MKKLLIVLLVSGCVTSRVPHPEPEVTTYSFQEATPIHYMEPAPEDGIFMPTDLAVQKAIACSNSERRAEKCEEDLIDKPPLSLLNIIITGLVFITGFSVGYVAGGK